MKTVHQNRGAPALSVRVVAVLGFACLYIPLVSLVVYSFLDIPQVPGGPREWTLIWYQKMLQNHVLLEAFQQSLLVGFWTTLCATVIGTAAALALTRSHFPGRKVFEVFTYLPLIMPEIVLGLALLTWFVFLKLTLGTFSIVLAHVTFSMSYVIMTVKARLEGFDEALEEAAQDLGATPWKTFWKVTFPLIWPGVLSGALMAFTLSFDDFLITFFTSGTGADTLPLKIYSMIKFGVTPEINALSTVMLIVTFLFVFIFFNPKKKYMTHI